MRAAIVAVLLAASPAAAETKVFTCMFAESVIMAAIQIDPDGTARGLGSLAQADRVIVKGDRITVLMDADLLQFEESNSVVVLDGTPAEGTCRDVTAEALKLLEELS